MIDVIKNYSYLNKAAGLDNYLTRTVLQCTLQISTFSTVPEYILDWGTIYPQLRIAILDHYWYGFYHSLRENGGNVTTVVTVITNFKD